MRWRLMAAVAVLIPVLCMCGKGSLAARVAGEWRGELREEGYPPVRVALTLRAVEEVPAGMLTVLSNTDDVIAEGDRFELLDFKIAGNTLMFVAPLSGQVDDDALKFRLTLGEGTLEGAVQEMRDGSHEIPIFFARAR